MSAPRPWRPAEGGGLLLAVRATPRGGRDRIEGVSTDAEGRTALAVRVSVPAEGGKANAAVLRLVARAAGLPRSAVTLEAGATARSKRLRLAGDAETLAARLEAALPR
ncbi:DUF167 family protein [Albimonas pacifica]|uniref:UPF0235 protein SAMN05216258_105145 n=1 Tax=Albimonas pacifica TaxID=1114924 RepID=A0A1I3GFY5_9RHOB|nr:DUF167 family protein [Albimonas pacifica]SFI22435.1 hypothetical protein SAMN05216258_105145 [Albimonas pacifica]